MTKSFKLSDICSYAREKVNINVLTNKSYISTDNMLQNCEGITETTTLPSTENVSAFQKGDILFSNIRPYFRKVWLADKDGGCSNDVLVLRPIKGISSYLLYFIVSNPSFINYVMSGANGSKMPRGDKTHILNYEIDSKVIENQEFIVSMLFPIEKLLNLNKTINDNLEKQAVLVFSSWFKSFTQSKGAMKDSEFGEIPSEFSIIKVGNIPMLITDYVANGSFASLKENVRLYDSENYAYFIRNTDLKSGSFEEYVDKHSYEFLSKSTLYGGEIIISNVGDVGSVFLCPHLDKPMTLGNNIIMLRPENDSLRYYLYIWFKYFQGKFIIQGIKGGSAQPKFNKTDFRNTSIILPPSDMISRFDSIVSPMFKMIEDNQRQTRNLISMRDILLPKLMTGQFDISEIG